MATVVISGAELQCSHGGKASITLTSGRLRVGSARVLVQGDEKGRSFETGKDGVSTPCPNTTKSQPPKSSPCTATLGALAGTAAKLTVDKKPVLLATAKGPVSPTDADLTPTWSFATSGQSVTKPLLTAT